MIEYSSLAYLTKLFALFIFGGAFIGVVLYVLFKKQDLEKNSDIPLRENDKKESE